MAKLPLGECPSCKGMLYDNNADFGAANLADIILICVYCGEAMSYDIAQGAYVVNDLSDLPPDERKVTRARQVFAKLFGRKVMVRALEERKRRGEVD